MNLKRIFLGAITALSLSVSAQSPVENLPLKVINGVAYHYYEVGSKETIYSICRNLGISQNELINLNPSVADGLKAGQTLYFPAEKEVTPRIHEVKNKETLYGIGKMYGVTQEQLCNWNPGAIDGIRPGQRLIVSEPAKIQAVPNKNIPTVENPEGYVIKEGETLYSIAKAHSTTVEAILEENPGLDKNNYKSGTVIVIPSTSQNSLTELVETPVPVIAVQSENNYIAENDVTGNEVVENEDAVPESIEVSDNTPITIAITLPFMLNSEEQSRQAQLYTEFYKGFLLAVDEMRNCGTPINLLVYDSTDPSGVSGIVNDPNLKNANLIVASDAAAQLSELGNYGKINNIDVLNLFVVKDETYQSNPVLMQGNIPHKAMYDKAIGGLLSKLGNYTPVILMRNNGERDKEEFIDELKSRLSISGIEFKEINYNGTMNASDLANLEAAGKYVFIPCSGKQVELNRILPAILEFKSSSTMTDPVMVFGYPEWITFRGETLSNMQKANTMVYSRFYTIPDSQEAKNVENRFVDWYGTQMANSMPRQGLFGYDAGMFVINWLKSGSDQPVDWDGIQNGFEFNQIPGGGKVNGKLYFINYLPDGSIIKSSL
ncbi:MAG: LysM peptidoglycan-binding domain-containing protein [Paramuribaculum sp.]|nr:LysM peptidoglycan-binding domain-containing protein [Paramuribaculum sp.]